MDRSVASGTGYAGQYPPEVAKLYEDAATTPDELLLFFHHVPYAYRLHSGKTVIQHIYDSHYEGAEQAAELAREWATLEGKIDQPLYEKMRDRLVYQAGHAIVWRDAIVQYFLKLSGIPDEKGRAGHYPGRLEAEDAKLTGYKIVDVNPWEDASGGKAVSCAISDPTGQREVSGHDLSRAAEAPKSAGALAPAETSACSVEWTWPGQAGRYNLAVQYFDLQGGVAKFTLAVDGHTAATWTADATLPSRRLHGDNSTRYTAKAVDLKPGDVLRVEGIPNGPDQAALDYIEVTAAH